MNRLTARVGNKSAVPCRMDFDFILDLDDADTEGIYAILNRLADYEETGLEPGEIKRLLQLKELEVNV